MSARLQPENERFATLPLDGVRSIVVRDATSAAVLESGRIMTWGHVREWTRPEPGCGTLSSTPILLWIDGLDQPR